jgi:hypothetical protein
MDMDGYRGFAASMEATKRAWYPVEAALIAAPFANMRTLLDYSK